MAKKVVVKFSMDAKIEEVINGDTLEVVEEGMKTYSKDEMIQDIREGLASDMGVDIECIQIKDYSLELVDVEE